MHKIKIFESRKGLGMPKSETTYFEELELKVNEFLHSNNIEVVDIKYHYEIVGGVILGSVMVIFKEK